MSPWVSIEHMASWLKIICPRFLASKLRALTKFWPVNSDGINNILNFWIVSLKKNFLLSQSSFFFPRAEMWTLEWRASFFKQTRKYYMEWQRNKRKQMWVPKKFYRVETLTYLYLWNFTLGRKDPFILLKELRQNPKSSNT